ncbi:DUF3500 domain-containing protein [Spirosoma validum]|uniref:DUF3500 domain-containing protein n=1 Tax=Spirosoma validum TaxID=2771355 RepID=A0A927GDB6_9BACT|nr:DUF3500 domain-containing protein [Spirosoma validum]MBD2753400.1 DUF3500 domain-containing protein [Spirosoma validum]
MNRQPIQLALSFLLFLCVVISCKKTENDIILAPSINCITTALTNTSFTNNGLAQSTTLSVGLSDALAGSITFNIASSNSNFTPTTYTTTVTVGQASVAIPLTFDGTSSVTSETITVSATTYGTGVCTAVATISAGSSTTTTTTDCSTATTPTAKVVCAANAFLATLNDAQKSAVVLSYTKDNAIKWSNLPCGSGCRVGLQLSSLTSTQVAAALAVVQAATGTTTNEGYDEIMQIRAADDVLGSVNSMGYSSGIYFIAFLGTPSTTSTWQFQFGGHHLAVNKTYNAGAVQGSTPQFEGVEPKSWTATNGTVYAPLNSEQAAMAAMLASLSSTQLASAKLSSTFSDVVLGPNNDGKFPATKVGLRVSSLTTEQQALVLAAMKPWVQDTDDASAASLLTTYQSELANTYIAYSGNTALTNNADYVRIDGPSVWIEFVCQTGVVYPTQIHYHSIWRDHTRDYGGNFTF